MIRELESRNHEVIITSRPLANTVELLDQRGLKHTIVGEHYGKNFYKKIFGYPIRVLQLRKFLKDKNIDVAVSEIEAKINEIIDFSELGSYIDLPVRVYSSGMLLRLAFSVSTSITADILIMDEWLSVGDDSFSEHASARMTGLVDQADIMIIASHNRDLIQETCNKVIWLRHGSVEAIGSPGDIVPRYFGPEKA
jgi:ABC-type multidrug transport system ATPase subunit